MILLTFDIEEFDMPFEYGKSISFDEQIQISTEGTEEILRLLRRHKVKATFFCTANFAMAAPELIRNIAAGGHEIASHGYYHSTFKTEDLLQSKLVLEQISKQQVEGYRMARMMPVDEHEIYLAGYSYNSSVNPTWLPGRYNNLNKPRTIFYKDLVLQLPASVSPWLRLPLFWLSFHNFPFLFYKYLCMRTYKADKYLNIYFHPWEFTDLQDVEKFGFPGYISKNTGIKMVERMEALIIYFKKKDLRFATISDFLKAKKMSHSSKRDETQNLKFNHIGLF